MTVACCIMFVSSVFVGCFVLTVVAADSSKKDVQPESVPAAADAKVTPNGLLVFRFKREPQLNRAMTFTGFMPNGGMTAFSAAADSFRQPTWYSKPAGPSDTLVPPSGESDQPAAEEEPNWAKKPKKKPYYPTKYYPNQSSQDEDEEEYEPPRGSKSRGGSATASFNAWFPIMFGSFPGSGSGSSYNRQGGGSTGPEPSRPSDSYSPYRSDFPGQTVIANSVSNGKGGVASSHAVAYGQRPEGRNYGGNDETPKMQPQSYY